MQEFNFKSLVLSALVLFSSALFFSSCQEDEEPFIPVTVTETLTTYTELSTLGEAIKQANLTSLIDGANLTLFAPTNTAFDAFLADNGYATLADVPTDVLNNLLLNHVVDGTALSADLPEYGYITTAANAPGNNNISMFVNKLAGVVLNGTSTVSTPDIDGTSGTIHIVDKVITIPTVVDLAVNDGRFTSLVDALATAELATTLAGEGPFTVFAPNDDATGWIGAGAGDLAEILLDHVVAGNVTYADLPNLTGPVPTLGTSGNNELTITVDPIDGSVTISDAVGIIGNVIFSDIQGSNGVVHMIDSVIIL